MAGSAGPVAQARPRLSVVIAAQDARGHVGECLRAVSAQALAEPVEIILVESSADGAALTVRESFPWVRVLSVCGRALAPELWEAGIRQSAADIVALLTAQSVPQDGWMRGLLAAHRRPAAAVGGAIACDPAAGAVGRAVYLCRYSAYMPPCREGPVADIAGDNASYKRAAIDGVASTWRNGFWEANVHAELRRAGQELWLDPSMCVLFRNAFRFGGFVRQRFWHGMRFARDQSNRIGRWQRVLRAAAWPIVPVVMLLRIGRRVLARRQGRQFAVALPIAGAFLVAWAAGEAVGYLRGPVR
jgi:hypothetical protein